MPVSGQVSFFGKVPCVLDYVRIRHVSAAGIACDQWLERSQQELARANAAWPSATFRFLFPSSSAEILVGVMAPSRDRAGRRFPATIYAAVSTVLVQRIGLVPLAFSRFFSRAEAVLAEDLSAGTEALEAKLAEILVPTRSDLEDAAASRQSLLRSRDLNDFADPLSFADATTAQASLQRFALGLGRSAQPRGTPVLCCPVQEDADVTIWLSLAEHKLGAVARSAWSFWTLGASHPRLYVGQGEVPVVLPVWFGSPRVRSERFWDLRPDEPHGGARRSEPGEMRSQGEKPPNLEYVFGQMG